MKPSPDLQDAVYRSSILGPDRHPVRRACSLGLAVGLCALMAGLGLWIDAQARIEGPRPLYATVALDMVEFPSMPPPPQGGPPATPRGPDRPADSAAPPPDPVPLQEPAPQVSPALATDSSAAASTGPAGGAPQGIQGGEPGGAVGGEAGALLPPAFNAAYLKNPAPHYPALSRRLGEEGRVLLKVLVGPDGRPGRVEIHQSSGHLRLDEAALATVARWRFVPARRGAESMAATVIVPIRFQLDS